MGKSEEQLKEQNIQSLEAENKDLKARLEEKTNAFEELKKELEEKVSELEKLKSENKDLKARLEEIDSTASTAAKRKVNKKGLVKIKFLFSPAGRFLLPYNVGQVVELPEKMADEIVESRYAEYVD